MAFKRFMPLMLPQPVQASQPALAVKYGASAANLPNATLLRAGTVWRFAGVSTESFVPCVTSLKTGLEAFGAATWAAPSW
jgi:hypothetical protein